MTPVLHDPWSVHTAPRFLQHPNKDASDRLSDVGGDDVRFHEKELPDA